MRQINDVHGDADLIVRSLAVDYSAGSSEQIHSHDWPQLLYAQSGALRAEACGNWWTVPPRRGLWIPAGVRHTINMSSRLKLRTLYFNPLHTSGSPNVRVVNVSGLLHEAILRVCTIGSLDRLDANHTSLATLILNEVQYDEASLVALTFPKDNRAKKLAKLFLNDKHANLAISSLCSQAGVGRRTAERLFLDQTGLTPAQWRRVAMLTESLVRIAEGEQIETAAYLAGYRSRSAFSEAFNRLFGSPPSKVRQS